MPGWLIWAAVVAGYAVTAVWCSRALRDDESLRRWVQSAMGLTY
jgi:threonine/homoserine/homoserine lactone efflux protein